MLTRKQLKRFVEVCKCRSNRYKELCGGVSIDTWENYNPSQRRNYLQTHPNSNYATDDCEDFDPYLIKGFCVLVNDKYVLCSYKERNIYNIKSLLKDAIYLKENRHDNKQALEKLQEAQIVSDWLELFKPNRTIPYRSFKLFKTKNNFYLIILDEFEI